MSHSVVEVHSFIHLFIVIADRRCFGWCLRLVLMNLRAEPIVALFINSQRHRQTSGPKERPTERPTEIPCKGLLRRWNDEFARRLMMMDMERRSCVRCHPSLPATSLPCIHSTATNCCLLLLGAQTRPPLTVSAKNVAWATRHDNKRLQFFQF